MLVEGVEWEETATGILIHYNAAPSACSRCNNLLIFSSSSSPSDDDTDTDDDTDDDTDNDIDYIAAPSPSAVEVTIC